MSGFIITLHLIITENIDKEAYKDQNKALLIIFKNNFSFPPIILIPVIQILLFIHSRFYVALHKKRKHPTA